MYRKPQADELDYNFCPTCKNSLEFLDFEGRFVLTCRNCGFRFWNNPRPVASALVFQNDSVLMIQRSASSSYPGYWSLPGGVINYLEEPEIALVREVREETGLDVGDLRLLTAHLIVSAPNTLEQRPSHTSIDLIYTARLLDESAFSSEYQNHETARVAFLPLTSLPSLIAFGHKEIILEYGK